MSKKMQEQFMSSSMMLPEHREKLNRRLKTLQRSEQFHVPDFDEQQWEYFECLLNRSISYGTEIKITARKKKEFMVITGVIREKNPETGLIKVVTGGEIKILPAKNILKIEKS